MYLIAWPALNLSKSLNSYFQPSFAVTVFESTFLPSANKLTVISSGRRPSWLSWSDHVFWPDTLVLATWCVLTMLLPLYVVLYPSTAASATVYLIAWPALNLSKPLNSYFQPSFAVTVFESTFSPSANKLTVISSGRTPSWSLLSTQVFSPLTEVLTFSFVIVLVTSLSELASAAFNVIIRSVTVW